MQARDAGLWPSGAAARLLVLLRVRAASSPGPQPARHRMQLLLTAADCCWGDGLCEGKCWFNKKNRVDCAQTQSLSSSWLSGSRLLTAARFGRSLLYTPAHHNPTHTHSSTTITHRWKMSERRIRSRLCASSRAWALGVGGLGWGLRTGRGRCGLEHDMEQRRAPVLCQPPPPKHSQHPNLRNFPLRQGSVGERLRGGPTKRAVDSS